jgi:hypothetical protein
MQTAEIVMIVFVMTVVVRAMGHGTSPRKSLGFDLVAPSDAAPFNTKNPPVPNHPTS